MIPGDHADVDDDLAGHRLYTLVVRTAPVPEREELAAAAAEAAGVVEARDGDRRGERAGARGRGRRGRLTRVGEELDELGPRVPDGRL